MTRPQDAFEEWWEGGGAEKFARKWPGKQFAAKVGFKAGYRIGYFDGRDEGYAKALRAARECILDRCETATDAEAWGLGSALAALTTLQRNSE